jgi:hypothetical protein
MYSYEDFGHIVMLLLVAGVILMIYRYFASSRGEDEEHSHPDL